jgi:hypothetical protein
MFASGQKSLADTIKNKPEDRTLAVGSEFGSRTLKVRHCAAD